MSRDPLERPAAIPLSIPSLEGNAWKYVKDCIDTNWVSSVGAYVGKFERQVADFLGRKYAVATNCGTSALHISLQLAGVQSGDEVLVSTLTFIAPANAVRYCGAWPIFIDAEPRYLQMDPQRVEEFLNNRCEWRDGALWNRATRRRVKAILPVHVLGHPVDLDPILKLARKYELAVVEDAAESLGAKYRGRMVGALGDLACISFNGNKVITTGGGGMLLTDDEAMAARARYLTTQAKDEPLEYVHGEVGYNYRMPNLLAAVGCSQMELLPKFLLAKRRIVEDYARGLAGIPGIELCAEAPYASSTFWLATIQVDPKVYGHTSRELCAHLRTHRIESRSLWQALHLSPAHHGAEAVEQGVAERLCQRSLNLPSSVALEPAEIAHVCQVIDGFCMASRETGIRASKIA